MCALATLAQQDWMGLERVHCVFLGPTRQILDLLRAPGVGKENSLR